MWTKSNVIFLFLRLVECEQRHTRAVTHRIEYHLVNKFVASAFHGLDSFPKLRILPRQQNIRLGGEICWLDLALCLASSSEIRGLENLYLLVRCIHQQEHATFWRSKTGRNSKPLLRKNPKSEPEHMFRKGEVPVEMPSIGPLRLAGSPKALIRKKGGGFFLLTHQVQLGEKAHGTITPFRLYQVDLQITPCSFFFIILPTQLELCHLV